MIVEEFMHVVFDETTPKLQDQRSKMMKMIKICSWKSNLV